MKKVFSSRIFLVVVTAIITTGGTALASCTYYSNQVLYSPSDNTWNVSNVKEALDDLYMNV